MRVNGNPGFVRRLSVCPDCGRDVSRKARFCVHCGRPWPGAASRSRLILLAVLGAVVLGAVGAAVLAPAGRDPGRSSFHPRSVSAEPAPPPPGK